MNKNNLYQKMIAVHNKDFNTCFYCGCIATEFDFAPPQKYADYYLQTRDEADFYQVPSCKECFIALKQEKSPLIGERADIAKRKIAKKYSKAINVYEMWDTKEALELDYNLQKCVQAGIELGEESSRRSQFIGFEFEVNGEKLKVAHIPVVMISVFEHEFSNFKAALDFASKTYRVPKAKLKDLYLEKGNSFNIAIEAYHSKMDKSLFDKKLKQLGKAFSKEHKQNVDFVMRTVIYYMKQDDSLSIELALNKLYQERIA
ncbi:hypothetical protein [Pseudoalteromonas denitrificans]|jgi:hypothetical protein|uniref:Uncharacterized protein n=1 Tax=Pseudoalteromonas denitrificans DSM 6059 TaxID=1123010 RepID=A0A1I1GAJ6_9GAMM|nr:hypothetical protein [Pseudoalteromonas denitrificans]SFC08585.1 hypothetical protein SAMN02745724_00878 [Pseudoalteromonas denitrificans DSM 6059]